MTAQRANKVRRGVGLVPAPRTPFVVLTLACVALCGCRSPMRAIIGERTVYVDVAALRDLHPAWQIAFSPALAPANLSRPGAPSLPEPMLLPPRIVEVAPLPETAPDRQAVGRTSRRDPLASLTAALEARDARMLAREAKTIRSGVEAEMAGRQRAMDVHHWLEDGRFDTRVAKAARDRELSEMSVRSRIAVLTGPARQDQVSELARVRRDATAADKRFELERVALRNRITQESYDLRHELEQTVADRMTARRAELAASTRAEVSSYRAGIGKVLETSQPVTREHVTAGSPASAAHPVAPADIIGGAPAARAAMLVLPPPSDLTLRNARMTALIDADLERWSRAVARERGWAVRFEPAPNRKDVTPVIRDMLRREKNTL